MKMRNKKFMITILLMPLLLFSQERFIDKGNIVYDNETKLYWQKRGSNEELTWDEAKSFCNNLSLDGYDDWRLPNQKELYYLADRSRYKPAINSNYFDLKSSWYWSSTTYKNDSSNAWYVYFDFGGDFWRNKSNRYYAVCVRGE